MAYYMGLDVGSTASKCVIIDSDAHILGTGLHSSGAGTKGPSICMEAALDGAGVSRSGVAATCATGYGRKLFKEAAWEVSELTCHAKGAGLLFPSAKTIIDIGGQDAKVLSVREGSLKQFVMNDKCAAGTGRFLDVMASIVGCSLDELTDLDRRSDAPVSISSTCTVFAESEVISKMAQGESSENVIAGVHNSVVEKTCGLVRRIGVVPDVAMTGGVALNSALVDRLGERLGVDILTDPRSQLNGALGAALIAKERSEQ